MLHIDHFFVVFRIFIELLMTSLRDYTTVIHEVYDIGSLYRREAVCDDDARASLHQVVECFLYESLCASIERAGCFI